METDMTVYGVLKLNELREHDLNKLYEVAKEYGFSSWDELLDATYNLSIPKIVKDPLFDFLTIEEEPISPRPFQTKVDICLSLLYFCYEMFKVIKDITLEKLKSPLKIDKSNF
ncbi:hypothetical protein A9Q84_14630 [Halobacteriovorax marinus]|uniref:Uncharacterized protein n=1 Tax=Halobacteriovorax marinus TaxID=97084 RepID=A0A1Y5FAR8_9BACT|nr:hypothetical protein A9Q84_14630 [Halobacteriovorax marinus]